MQDGSLVYYIAGVAVAYNPQTHTQMHFAHHDDVTGIAFAPNG